MVFNVGEERSVTRRGSKDMPIMLMPSISV